MHACKRSVYSTLYRRSGNMRGEALQSFQLSKKSNQIACLISAIQANVPSLRLLAKNLQFKDEKSIIVSHQDGQGQDIHPTIYDEPVKMKYLLSKTNTLIQLKVICLQKQASLDERSSRWLNSWPCRMSLSPVVRTICTGPLLF